MSAQHLDVLLSQLRLSDKNRVKAEVQSLQREYKNLIPRTGVLARNDGTIENVLVLGGTAPIIYGGVQYNIPLELFLLEQFPQKAPEIFIRPTSNMTIKANHRNVDMQGMVYLPYLHSWSSSSNIVQLMQSACSVFSKDPPLFAKTEPSSTQYAQARPTTYSTNHGTSNNSQSQTSMASIYGGSSAVSGKPRTATISRIDIPDHLKEKKSQLISQITSRLQEEILLQQTRLKDEIEQEFTTSQDLSHSSEAAKKYRVELNGVMNKMKEEIATLRRQDEELESWKSSKESAMSSDEAAQQLLSRLKPYDEVSEQLVALQSEHNAIDDAIYYLQETMRHNRTSMTLDDFLGKVRDLSSKQFLCRAHIRKIEDTLKNDASG